MECLKPVFRSRRNEVSRLNLSLPAAAGAAGTRKADPVTFDLSPWYYGYQGCHCVGGCVAEKFHVYCRFQFLFVWMILYNSRMKLHSACLMRRLTCCNRLDARLFTALFCQIT